jgi:hypothetical protein
MLVKYFDQDTVNLCNNLLPTKLAGKTNKEIKNMITTDYNLFKTLGHFSVRTEQYKSYRQRGMDTCNYQVNWKNEGGIKSLSQMQMINLNYYIYTFPNAVKLCPFAFSVQFASGLNYNYQFQQAQASEGRFVPYNYVPYS